MLELVCPSLLCDRVHHPDGAYDDLALLSWASGHTLSAKECFLVHLTLPIRKIEKATFTMVPCVRRQDYADYGVCAGNRSGHWKGPARGR